MRRRRRIPIALAAVLAAMTFACAPREDKKVAPVDAGELSQDKEVLDELRSVGSDLTKPHQIEFYLYLPSEPDAEAAGAELRSMGYPVTVRVGPDSIHWLCLASRTMLPTTQGLADARVVFKDLALKYKGAYDGWQAEIVRPSTAQ